MLTFNHVGVLRCPSFQTTMLNRIFDLVLMCKPASRIIMAMESNLCRAGANALHTLPALEQLVKTIAQDSATISGVFYELTTQTQGWIRLSDA